MPTQNAGLEVKKIADTTRSKVGDTINYTITVSNTGETDLTLESISDTILGSLTSLFPPLLSPGQSASVTVPYTVKATDPDPLVNTVLANYTTRLSVRDTVSVNLFQPSITLVKSGPPISKAGDTVTYTYTIINSSSSDTPNLILDSMIDNVAGDLTSFALAAGWSNLAPGSSRTFTFDYVVKDTDDDPLVNIATVNFHPEGFPNNITATASHTIDILHPSFTVTKTCVTGTAVAGGTANFRVDITNTGDTSLDIVAVDRGVFYRSDSLQPGATFTFNVNVPVPSANGTCTREVTNTVDVTATVTAVDGFKLPNIYTKSATATCLVIYRGRTSGFWQNNNGHAILDPDRNGIINNPVTIGSGPRSITVTTISDSDKILNNSFCNVSGSNCVSRSDALQQNTLERLVAQTLALAYNISFIPCYTGQLVSDLGCGSLLAPTGLPANSTVNDVLVQANFLIGNSTSAGTTTQAQASAMINLINCLNQE